MPAVPWCGGTSVEARHRHRCSRPLLCLPCTFLLERPPPALPGCPLAILHTSARRWRFLHVNLLILQFRAMPTVQGGRDVLGESGLWKGRGHRFAAFVRGSTGVALMQVTSHGVGGIKTGSVLQGVTTGEVGRGAKEHPCQASVKVVCDAMFALMLVVSKLSVRLPTKPKSQVSADADAWEIQPSTVVAECRQGAHDRPRTQPPTATAVRVRSAAARAVAARRGAWPAAQKGRLFGTQASR